MTEQTFLVEIGTEELPPKALRSLAEAFAAQVTAELDAANLSHGEVSWFAAPRRLALKVANLSASQPDREVEKRGPAVAAAFDADGNATKAAEGWARGNGITVDQAERLATDKGEWLVYRAQVKGEAAQALLPAMIATALSKLPVPKLMRWGNSDVQFVRPVHTVTMLLGDELIPALFWALSQIGLFVVTALWVKAKSRSTTPISTLMCWKNAARSLPTIRSAKR